MDLLLNLLLQCEAFSVHASLGGARSCLSGIWMLLISRCICGSYGLGYWRF